MKPEPIGIVAAIQDQERKEQKKTLREFNFLEYFGNTVKLAPREGEDKILSTDHVCKLLKLGLDPVPSEGKKPKFTIPTWPIDPLNPFKGTDSDGPEFTQMDVARVVDGELVTVECIAEVDGYNTEEPELGACFDLQGNEIILTPEEREKNLDEWKAWMEENARG